MRGRPFVASQRHPLGVRRCVRLERQSMFRAQELDADPNLAPAVDLTWSRQDVMGELVVDLLTRADPAVEQIFLLLRQVDDAEIELAVGRAHVVHEVNLVDEDRLRQGRQVEIGKLHVLASDAALDGEVLHGGRELRCDAVDHLLWWMLAVRTTTLVLRSLLVREVLRIREVLVGTTCVGLVRSVLALLEFLDPRLFLAAR